MAGYRTYYKLAPVAVFRRAMKMARAWPELCGMDQTEEKMIKEVDYIKSEARFNFGLESNRRLTDPSEIQELLKNAMNRMDIAEHYKIPYPRPVHTGTGSRDMHAPASSYDPSSAFAAATIAYVDIPEDHN